MALLAIRHFVSPTLRGRIILVGDALGVWYSMIRLTARSPKINEIAKELALHLAPMGHEFVGIHVWSDVMADALRKVGERGSMLPKLHQSRRGGVVPQRTLGVDFPQLTKTCCDLFGTKRRPCGGSPRIAR